MESRTHSIFQAEVGMAILSGIDALPHPYVLFDDRGRLQYSNPRFAQVFGEEAGKTNFFTLLRDKLGIDDFSRSFSDSEGESLCIGFLKQQGGPPKTFRLLGAQVTNGRRALFQCILSQVKPLVALQFGISGIEMRDKVSLAEFVGSIAVEMDPDETGQHLIRTSQMLDRLCRTMKASGVCNLPEADIEAASMYSILHDVGKMRIPAELLHKPEKLSEFEWGIIKSHVVSGLTIAETMKLPKIATDLIAYHHCRWDGVRDRWDEALQARDPERGGYPFSAKGVDIPILARAFAYVDVFDALVTPRSYKPAWSAWEATAHIRDTLVGTHLDPGIFPSFHQSLDGVPCWSESAP
ncbi:HD domain-containing phosphohydrolase [Humidesulfovibrio sp.]